MNDQDDACRLLNHFPGLQQMISYALANPGFATCLMHDPSAALARLPTEICLNSEEDALVRQVHRTANLHSFAAYLHALIEDANIIQIQRAIGNR